MRLLYTVLDRARGTFEVILCVYRPSQLTSDDRMSSAYIISMTYEPKLESISTLSDDELLRRLPELLKKSRRVESELIAHIGEVDQRRLYARRASSMFTYSTEVLHLSEHEAYLRIEVARASRKHPVLLEMFADGRLHLSGIVFLRPHLSEANREMLLRRATHKTKREIEQLVAELFPEPDVPTTMRKLPERRGKSKSKRIEQVQEPVQTLNSEPLQKALEVGLEAAVPPAPPSKRPAVVAPLSAATYKIQFTASAELRNKLERLESKRYGKTKAPRKSLEETDTSPSSRYIPAPVKRAVFERDGGQCTYEDLAGRRYTETERDYGKEVMERYRSAGSRVSEPAAVYTFNNRATSVRGVVPAVP